jgi:hypothetical protein
LVCPETTRFNTSASHAKGSMSLSLADWISVAMIDQWCPPLSAPVSRVQQMRVALAKLNRWPEMLTYEEANKDIPKGGEIIRFAMQHVLAEEFKEGFIFAGEKLRAGLMAKRKARKPAKT